MKKYEHVYRHLRGIIDDLAPGEIVPSVREVMDDCNVSLVTVTRAMNHLKQDGMVVSRIGEGTFKAGRTAPVSRVYHIALFMPDYPSAFSASVQSAFKLHFHPEAYRLKVLNYDYHNPRLTRSMIKGNVDGVVVFAGTNFEVESVAALRRLGLPTVIINLLPGGVALDAVCTDNEFGGAMAADWLLKNGHTGAAVILSQPHGPTLDLRRAGFERQFQLAGHRVQTIDCRTANGADSLASSYHCFRQLASAGPLGFTALFCDSDLGAFGVMKACRELGLAVPGDLSIIGYDNLPEGAYFHPSLASIDQNVTEWSRETERILSQRLQHGGSPAIQSRIQPSLIIRNSVRAIHV